MDLMREYGVNVPRGAVASTPEEAEKIYTDTLNSAGKGEYAIQPSSPWQPAKVGQGHAAT
jgi:hypothetical protein